MACSNRERNTAVHGESKVCGTHFEGGKNGANDIASTFAWTMKKKTTPSPKEQNVYVASCVNHSEQASSLSESQSVCSVWNIS